MILFTKNSYLKKKDFFSGKGRGGDGGGDERGTK